MKLFARALAVSAAALLTVAACGGGATTTTTADVTVEMKEFTITLTGTTTAGARTFLVKNTGSSAHDLVIIKTDLAADKLPVDSSNNPTLDGKVAATAVLNPSSSANLSATLAAANYVFICSQPGHYALGMRTQVVVK